MGELIRKFVSRRILQACKQEVNFACLSARQWGVGAEGGAEGIVHTHKTIEELYELGQLPTPLAAVMVDAENCFGLLEWDSIRQAVQQETPNLAPAVAWKHSVDSFVEQPDVEPQLKDRGAEQ
eukprot:11230886-Karenia_brevis.AAC.1